jgi:hypothetical protein
MCHVSIFVWSKLTFPQLQLTSFTMRLHLNEIFFIIRLAPYVDAIELGVIRFENDGQPFAIEFKTIFRLAMEDKWKGHGKCSLYWNIPLF